MKKIAYLLGIVFLFFTFYSCGEQLEIDPPESINSKDGINITETPSSSSKNEGEITYCGKEPPKEYTLWAGQHINAGTVKVWNDKDFLYIAVKSTFGFKDDVEYLKINVVTALPDKRPSAGQFPYKTKETNDGTEVTYSIPLSDLFTEEECLSHDFYILVHVDVRVDNGEETAWGGSDKGRGNSWWYYIDYATQCCGDIKGDDSDDSSDENSEDNSDDGSDDSSDDNTDDGSNNNTDDGTDDNSDSTDDSSDDSSESDSGSDTGSGSDDNPSDTPEDSLVCLDAFAYFNSDNSTCFIDGEFSQCGWTNNLTYSMIDNNSLYMSYEHQFPLYINTDQCNVSSGIQIGYVDLYISGGDGRFYADVEYVITNSNYKLDEANLYIGADKYPKNMSGSDSVSTLNYTYWGNSIDASQYLFEGKDWPSNAYFIAHAKVCPIE